MHMQPQGPSPNHSAALLTGHMPSSSLEMPIPRVTHMHVQALSISASMVFDFLAWVFLLNFCSMAVSAARPSFPVSSKHFAAQARAAFVSARSVSIGTVKPLDNEISRVHASGESCGLACTRETRLECNHHDRSRLPSPSMLDVVILAIVGEGW